MFKNQAFIKQIKVITILVENHSILL